MLVRAKCRKCNKDGLIDIGSLTREQAEQLLSNGNSHCTFGELSHHEVVPPIELFELDWDNVIDEEVIPEDLFKDELVSKFEEVLTKEELESKYNIESFAFSACLCSHKETEQMIVFNLAVSPEGKRYYIR